MASVNRIDSIYDVDKIAAEQSAVEKLVRASIEQIKQARGQSIDLNVNTKSFSDYQAKIKELEKTLGQMGTASDKAAKASLNLSKAKQAEAKAAEAAAKAKLTEAKADEVVIKTILAEEKAERDALKTKQAKTKASDDAAKQMANEVKLIDQVTDDYLQLSKAYNDASRKAKNYVLTLGESHPITVAAIKDANDMGNVLKRLDASVGQHQRNVGNYASAYNGLGMSFAQVSRELPSLTISVQQFALAISNNLPMVADEIARAKNEIAALRAEGKETPSLLSRVGKALLSWQVGLSVGIALLTAYAGKLAEWGRELITGAENSDKLAESQKKLADTIRDVNAATQEGIRIVSKVSDERLKSSENELSIAEAAGKKEIDLLAMQLSIAKRRKEIADDEINNQIRLTQQTQRSRDLEITGLESLREEMEIARARYQLFTDQVVDLSETRILALAKEDEAEIKSIDKKIEVAKANQALEKQKYEDYLASLQNQQDAEADILRIQAEIEKERLRIRKEREEKEKEIRERNAAAEFETLKANIELDKQFDSIRLDNEKLSLAERLAALAAFGNDSKRLIEAQAAFELSNADLTAKERIKIENDRNNELIRLAQDTADKLAKILERSFEVDTSKLAEGLNQLPKDIQKAQAEFEKAQKDFQEKYKKALEQLKKDTNTAILSLASELENLFFDIFTNAIERQKNAVQDQIDLLEQQKQKDIEVANQTIANAADRADAIAVIEARAAAKRQQLELRQRQLDQQKARFEKARAVAEIVQSTAVAVVNALSQVKTLGPAAIALAGVIGALGAVQIARVLAQPIPRYAEGTENHPGGLAVVGDGGKPEGIIMPDGSTYKTPATDTVVNLPKGAKVIPDYADLKKPNVIVNIPDNSADMQKGFAQVVSAIKRIPQPIIRAERAWTQAHKTGSSFRNYINQSI